MALIDDAFLGLSQLRLWFKNRAGQALQLSDVPGIIPLRYPDFRDNWEFTKLILKARISQAPDPDRLEADIKRMSDLIEVQRSSQNQNVNPFSRSSILTDFFAVWDNLDISSLPLTKEEQAIINKDISTINAYIKTDFERIRTNIIKARDEIADIVGGNDDAYNAAFTRSSVPKLRDIRIKDIQNMKQLQEGIRGIDFILANSGSILRTVSVDPFALARQNANNPDVEIQSGKSGRLVRMHFGDSLQILADRYLGDSDRWPEIAIANGLRPPYVDEIGQRVFLLANSSGNQINIASKDTEDKPNIDKFYVGQAVFLTSDTIKFPEQRSIINIREIPVSGEIVLELDGENDLDKFKLLENANIRVYLPNTINSLFFVTIPTTQSAVAQIGETPFFLSNKSQDEKQAGIDLAFDGNLDLVFTPTSDLSLSFGLANAVQAVQIKMISEKGQNARHPSFGIASIQGAKLDQPDETQDALIKSITDMIESDTRFERVENLGVTRVESRFLVKLEVRLAGSQTVIPISFSVNTG